MDQRYTYGYDIGWNVENEYINSLNEIMEAYNMQAKAINDIEVDRGRLENKLANTLSEEEIRKTYEEYYTNGSSMRSYDAFKADVLGEQENEKMQIRRDLEQNKNQYFANLYYLTEVKQEARKEINQRRRELNLLLSEKRIELSSINLQQQKTRPQYDANGVVINSDELKAFNKNYDEVWLEIRKIEHVLELLDAMYSTLEFTQEEGSLMMRGLNPQERRYYEEIINNPEKEKQKTLGGNNNNNNDDNNNDNNDNNDDNNDDDKNEELDEEIIIDEFDLELEKYNAMLAEYEKLLEEYNKELERLYALQGAYENNEITYAEYEEYANYMKERYEFVLQKYNEVYAFYMRLKELLEEISKYDSLSVEELDQKLKDLENKRNELWQVYAQEYNGEIPDDENLWEEINNEIKKVKQAIARKKNKYASLSTEELEKMLEELENEFKAEYQFRVHEQNGMEYNDDDFIENYNKKKKAITAELKRRNRTIKEPIPPKEPQFVLEKEEIIDDVPEIKGNYKDFDRILRKICGDVEKFDKFDNFIYTRKDIKVFNWQKSKAFTLADKPFKLVKATIGTIINGGTKIFSKAAYKKLEKRREKIDQVLANVQTLTEDELDYLLSDAGYTALKRNRGVFPDIAWNALYSKLLQRINVKVKLANVKIESLYKKLIDTYKECLEIKKQLDNPNITKEEKSRLEHQFKVLTHHMCNDIIELENTRNEIDNLANSNGRHGMQENFRVRKNNVAGGFNASNKDHGKERIFSGKLGELAEGINQGNFDAVEKYLYKERFKVENTYNKKSLKNWGKEYSAGAYENNFLIEYADYSQNTYLTDVIYSIILLSSIVDIVSKTSLKQAIDSANQEIENLRGQISTVNQQIQQLKNIFDKYNSDPDQFIEEFHKFVSDNVTRTNTYSEYISKHAEAGTKTAHIQSTGPTYNLLDNPQHNLSDLFVNRLNAIKTNPALSVTEKTNEIVKVFTESNENFVNIIKIHGKAQREHLDAFSHTENFTAMYQALDLLGVGTTGYIPQVFNDLIGAATLVGNMQALNAISKINLSVSIAPQIANITAILGRDAIETYKRTKEEVEKEESLEERNTKIANMFKELPFDLEKEAKANFDRKNAEWEEKGLLYRITHRKEKPSLNQERYEAFERSRSL